jgi:soluble cytochrome b562
MMDAVKKQLAQTAKEIENIVSVIAKTGSEALIERLNETERSKKELEYRYEKLSDETGAYLIDADRLTDAFKKARQLLKTGELKQTKAMIERYVKQIVIYHDRIEVFLNLGVDTDFRIEKDKENPLHSELQIKNAEDSSCLYPRRGYAV